MATLPAVSAPTPTTTLWQRLSARSRHGWQHILRRRWLYILLAPTIIYFTLFHYVPMYGAVIAFKDYSPFAGIWESPWVGLQHFQRFFDGIFFWRLLRNTFLLSFYYLIASLPGSVILALMLNEVRNQYFKRIIQTVSYLPYFISTVVVVGIVINFLSPTTGIINVIIRNLGGAPIPFLTDPDWFRFVYVSSGVWQNIGWGSVVYLAALTGIDPQLYDAAEVDGAGRWQKIWHISLPGIMPVVMIMLLLNLGAMLNVGFEKVFLLYSPSTYETADVYSTYIYRSSLLGQQFSFGTAVGLFNAAINLVLLLIFNRLARLLEWQSLW